MNESVESPAEPTLSPVSPAEPADPEVERVRALLKARQFAEALHAAEALVQRDPGHRDALYLAALAQRQLQRIPEALSTLARLERHHPGYSRLYQERGHCHVALKDAPHAIDAFLRAVNINPALPASWSLLEGLYRMTGQADLARTAAAHVATLRQQPPELLQATGLFADGELGAAESVVRAFLQQHGHHIEGMRLLARIAMRRDVLDEAELLLEAVLDLAPDYQAARYDYAVTLVERHRYLPARAEIDKLLKLEPANRSYRTLYATALAGLGDNAQAVGLYRALLADTPGAADLHLLLAHSLKTLGQTAEAIEAYRQAAALSRQPGEAWWSLANLKTYRFSAREIARLRAAEAAATPGAARAHGAEAASRGIGSPEADHVHLCFALGKALEDQGAYAESWRYYERGNALKRAESRYRPEIIENNTRLQIEVCTRDFFAARAGSGVPDPDPIFIVGLPRSGSTLIEQILASHSQVEGTQELADIQRLVLELQGPNPDLDHPRYPGVLSGVGLEDLRRFGARYLADTRALRHGKPYFIDKMPNNFRHLGLIRLILPNAKIIDARREPLACCFSNLKQLFASGQEFSYSVADIARYYRTYLDLMRHWDAVLPGWVLRVQHEDVVDDLEANVRRILDFCGLPFEAACLEFYRTERSIRTASSEQVRQPIYREGIDQWKHYEPWLGELRAALGDALLRYREAPAPRSP
jgi:tetratricopeptide (TPR) repeat protein